MPVPKTKAPYIFNILTQDVKEKVITSNFNPALKGTTEYEMYTVGEVTNGKRRGPFTSRDTKSTPDKLDKVKEYILKRMGVFVEILNYLQTTTIPFTFNTASNSGLLISVAKGERAIPLRLDESGRLEAGHWSTDCNSLDMFKEELSKYLAAPSPRLWREHWNALHADTPAEQCVLTGDYDGVVGSELRMRGATIRVFHYTEKPHLIVDTKCLNEVEMAPVLSTIQGIIAFRLPKRDLTIEESQTLDQMRSDVELH